MSDRSPEDEMIAQARQFSAAMRTAMQRHAQAANWIERRRARKEISRLVRQERREQQQSRTNHLSWTNQAVDRYRLHAETVAARANDPRVDHDRRARDARALAEHRDRLAAQFIGDGHLTRTEQGIALDGLDAATVFPEYKTGNLFARAHKVKGLEALHYRARVARETVSINRSADRERAEWQKGLDAAHRANAEEALLARIDAAQPDRHRYTAAMTWTDPDGGKLTESRAFATEHTATEWLQRNISGTSWSDGTTLQVETRDTANAAKQYVDHGRPETVAGQLAAREAVLRERTLAGQVHREQPAAQARETGQEQQAKRFSSTVTYLPQNANQVVHERGSHATEADSARWTAQQLAGIRPAPGTTVHVAAFDLADEWRPERVFRAEGGRSMVADEVTQWREGIERGSGQERDEQQLPASVQQIAAERDQLAEDLAQRGREIEQLSGDLVDAANRNNQLTNRHRLSIEHNNQLTEANARLTQQLTALTAERDQLRSERDQAVQKLAERTPAGQRYGSPERQAEQAKAAAYASDASEQTPVNAFAGLSTNAFTTAAANGYDREGIER
ncbi:hypothetical protein IU450_38620 [Nocardia abscessus]|uniref:hypothetical protein n=1 Tax=Nocardia abscessus TaxID=120957 RepID=UPI00189398C4|nr:hypothetical protein [Nocardia abscessus]MBF6341751.1 hypothetical protein [Nocardia abscessus]